MSLCNLQFLSFIMIEADENSMLLATGAGNMCTLHIKKATGH